MNFPNPLSSPVVLAATGASGQLYARWVLKTLIEKTDYSIRLLISSPAKKIIRNELNLADLAEGLPAARVRFDDPGNMECELASGSFTTAGMIICPCSLNTLAAVATGISDNLIKRAAQVHIKERRKLILAVREMPLGTIDLENMVRLAHAGAIVTPLSPPFYHHPKTLDDLAEFTAQKIVRLLFDIENAIRYKPVAGE